MKKIILLLCIIINSTSILLAQSGWVKTSTQNIGAVTNIAIAGSNIVILTNNQIFLSIDNGATWVLRSGAPSDNLIINFLATDGTDLFIATGNALGAGVYKSVDLGLTWTYVSPAFNISNDAAETLLVDQNNIYVGTHFSGVYRSSLTGINSNSWTPFNNGLVSFIPPYLPIIKSLKISGISIYAGTYGNGVWISSTNSPNWVSTSGMVAGAGYIIPLCINDSIALGGNVSGAPILYSSVDSGHNWNPVNSNVFLDQPLNVLINNADTIFAGSANGVLISTDNGANWREYNDGFKDGSGNWVGNGFQQNVNSLITNGGKIYAGTGDGVWTRSLLVVLPVKLLSFDVTYKNSVAYITWNTATESNLNKFEIEKSIDGATFKKIGEVKAIGNSSLVLIYNFVDNNIPAGYSGNIFFRLKQLDFDGKFIYSPVNSIKIKYGNQQIQVYPNPATQEINVQISPLQVGLNYHITNTAGQQVLSGKLLNIKTVIDVRNFKANTYFLKIEAKNLESIKILKQ